MTYVTCRCGARLKTRPSSNERRTRCPRCSAIVAIPAAPQPMPPTANSLSGRPRDIPHHDVESPSLTLIDPVVILPPRPLKPGPAGDERDADAALTESPGNFWRDAMRAYLYPFASGGNAVNALILMFVGTLPAWLVLFALVCLISFVTSFYGVFPFCFAALGCVIVYGWQAGAFMSVIRETAASSDSLPGISFEGGYWEDIVLPFLNYLGTSLIAWAPAIVYAVLVYTGRMTSNSLLLFWCAAFGIVVWPIVMMWIALGAGMALFRLDLVVTAAACVFVPSLPAFAALLAGTGIVFLQLMSPAHRYLHLAAPPWLPPGFQTWTAMCLLQALDVYLTLVTLRIAGLYYLHHKGRMGVKLE